jgi:hypothetical protein
MTPEMLAQVLGLLLKAADLMAPRRADVAVEPAAGGDRGAELPPDMPDAMVVGGSSSLLPDSAMSYPTQLGSPSTLEGLQRLTLELAKFDPVVARGYYGEQAAFDVAAAVEALLRERKPSMRDIRQRSGLSAARLRAILEGSGAGKTTIADLAVFAHALGSQVQVVFAPLPTSGDAHDVHEQARQVAALALDLVRATPAGT